MISIRIKDAIRERRKEREKKKIQRDKIKRRSRKYGQAELKHSKKGGESCFAAAITLFFIVLVFSVSYITRGDVGLSIGLVGLGTLFLSVYGIYSAIQGFRERDKNYITCKCGIVLNGIFFIGLCVVFLRGIF